jgi:hypothetical protein
LLAGIVYRVHTFYASLLKEWIMAVRVRLLTTAALIAGLATAPSAHAERWHGHGHYQHHNGGNAAAGAIIGGLVGLGVGAAIASGGGYYPPYYPPPPVYYGAPPGYYQPPPPVYYGYGYRGY